MKCPFISFVTAVAKIWVEEELRTNNIWGLLLND